MVFRVRRSRVAVKRSGARICQAVFADSGFALVDSARRIQGAPIKDRKFIAWSQTQSYLFLNMGSWLRDEGYCHSVVKFQHKGDRAIFLSTQEVPSLGRAVIVDEGDANA